MSDSALWGKHFFVYNYSELSESDMPSPYLPSLLFVFCAVFAIGAIAGTAESKDDLDCAAPYEVLVDEHEELISVLKGDFGTVTILGKGSFGVVVKVTDPAKKSRVFKLSKDPVALIRENSFSDRINSAFSKKYPNRPSPFPTIRFHRSYQALELQEAKGVLITELGKYGPSHLQTSLDAIYELSGAIQFAHKEGFVHRDIKPENILVGQDGRLILTDWGIAAKEGTSERSAGSPGYMTEQQVVGSVAKRSMDSFGLRQTAIGIILGKELYDDHLRGRGFTAERSSRWPRSSGYRVFSRSPRGIDQNIPRSISAALWRNCKTVEEQESLLRTAEKHVKENKEREFFQKVLSNEIERALVEDPRRMAAEFITSPELMEAGVQGWLKLSPSAKQALWNEAFALYQLKNDFTIPSDYPWPPILDSPFRAALITWNEHQRMSRMRRSVYDTLMGKAQPPF